MATDCLICTISRYHCNQPPAIKLVVLCTCLRIYTYIIHIHNPAERFMRMHSCNSMLCVKSALVSTYRNSRASFSGNRWWYSYCSGLTFFRCLPTKQREKRKSIKNTVEMNWYVKKGRKETRNTCLMPSRSRKEKKRERGLEDTFILSCSSSARLVFRLGKYFPSLLLRLWRVSIREKEKRKKNQPAVKIVSFYSCPLVRLAMNKSDRKRRRGSVCRIAGKEERKEHKYE